MPDELVIKRWSGIEIIGDVPWGTHLCQFYHSREDLLDILVPYFKAGLENNEYCMWITSAPLHEKEAEGALRKALPDLDVYIEKKQIEIIPYNEWYLIGGVFDRQMVLNGWVERLNQALARGYDGLRLTGNTFWLEKSGWHDFSEYEAIVDGVIGNYRMIAICAYSLDRCGAFEVIDVVKNHQFALVKQEEKWVRIESSEHKASGKRIEKGLEQRIINRTAQLEALNKELRNEVAERKRMAETLIESEDKFKAIAVSAQDAIIIMDDEAKISYWNHAAARMFGYSMEEAIGKDLHKLIVPPVQYEGFSDGFKRFQKIGEGPVIGKTLELAGLRKDGTEFYAEHSISAVKIKGKWHAIGIARDISERKRAEKALIESEERLRLAQEGARIGIWDWHVSTGALQWTPELERIYGLEPGTVHVYQDWFKRTHPEDVLRVETERDAAIAQHKPFNIEFRIILGSGEIRWVSTIGRSIYNDNGTVARVVGINLDITDRKKAEEVIEQAKREYEATFDAISEPIFIHDKEFKIIRANRAYQQMAGVKFKEFIGKPYFEVFPKMDKPFKVSSNDLELQEGEEVFFCPDKDRTFKIKFYPINDLNGRYLYSVHVMEDITDIKKSEERIKEEMEVTSRLLMISEATAHTTDIDKLMEQVVHCSHEIVKCDICLSYLWDANAKVFRPSQAYGLSRELVPLFKTGLLDMKVGFVKKAMKKKAPTLTLRPLPEGEGWGEGNFSWLPDINTIAVIPLFGREEPLGIIVGVNKKEVSITDRDRKVMRGISHQVSTALEQARLYKETLNKSMELSHKIETIQVMHEIDRNILSTLEMKEILQTITRLISRVIPSCDRATVSLVDEEKHGFTYVSGFGTSVVSIGAFVPFEDTSATDVVKTERTQYIADMREVKGHLPIEERFLKEGFISHIRIPLIVKGDVVAVLTIGSKRPAAFTPDDFSTIENIASQIGVALEHARLISDLKELFLGTVKSLSSAIDAKSPWTSGHSERVTKYALDIAKEMGLSEKELKDLELAGLLHDVGKIGTYESILDKPGKLTDEEFELIKKHPAKGAEMLGHIKQLEDIIPAVRHHHEFYNGKGYPDGMKGEEITLITRILTVADTYDAMKADRPYRPGRTMEYILEEFKNCSGTQFDPKVVEAFLKIADKLE